MPSRDDILAGIRRHPVTDQPHPGAFTQGIVYPDPIAQFQTVLEAIGGRCETIDSADQATAILAGLEEYATAAKRCSLVPGVGESTFDLMAVADPHDLHDTDFSVMPGALAVAENGAIWVTTPDVRQRTMYFLMQHLAIVVPRHRVVSNMHQAYAEIDVAVNPFGTWLAGPSKTADIEQSLVKGAHGSRTLLVFLLENA